MTSKPIELEVELTGESHGHCDCCGNDSHTVWGMVHEVQGPSLAAYWVRWTHGHIAKKGANLDLVVGKWGEGTSANDRASVALLHREVPDQGPQIMVVDAKHSYPAKEAIAANALTRSDVVGTPLANHIFSLIDAIYLQDNRFF